MSNAYVFESQTEAKLIWIAAAAVKTMSTLIKNFIATEGAKKQKKSFGSDFTTEKLQVNINM